MCHTECDIGVAATQVCLVYKLEKRVPTSLVTQILIPNSLVRSCAGVDFLRSGATDQSQQPKCGQRGQERRRRQRWYGLCLIRSFYHVCAVRHPGRVVCQQWQCARTAIGHTMCCFSLSLSLPLPHTTPAHTPLCAVVLHTGCLATVTRDADTPGGTCSLNTEKKKGCALL